MLLPIFLGVGFLIFPDSNVLVIATVINIQCVMGIPQGTSFIDDCSNVKGNIYHIILSVSFTTTVFKEIKIEYIVSEQK